MIPRLKELGYKISYIGSYEGMESKLIEDLDIPYYGISSGTLRRYFDVKNFTDPFRVIKGFFEAKKLMKQLKPDVVFSKGGFVTVPVVLRRYFDVKNFTDPFRVIKGFFEAKKLMKQLKPDVVFSKGGFVTVPVVIAASKKHIPTFIHESDMTPGLANKISIPFATKVCCNFPETVSHLPEDKAVLTGTPIRQELLEGNPEKALEFTGLSKDKPVILIIGGSLGAAAVNDAVRKILPEFRKKRWNLQVFPRINLLSSSLEEVWALPLSMTQ